MTDPFKALVVHANKIFEMCKQQKRFKVSLFIINMNSAKPLVSNKTTGNKLTHFYIKRFIFTLSLELQ